MVSVVFVALPSALLLVESFETQAPTYRPRGQQASPYSRRFQIPESVPCSSVAMLVEGTLLGGQRAEQPIEQKEADAEVFVH